MVTKHCSLGLVVVKNEDEDVRDIALQWKCNLDRKIGGSRSGECICAAACSQGFRYHDEKQRNRVEKTLADLRACSTTKNLERGRLVHAQALDNGDMTDKYVANSVINMYARCGSLAQAQKVFDSMDSRTTASWTALVFGYSEHGSPGLALEIFEKMLESSGTCRPDGRTFVAALQACTKLAETEDGRVVDGKLVKFASLQKGMAVHWEVASLGLEGDIFVGNTLVNMYIKCGTLAEAARVFHKLLSPNVISWTSLLLGYAENGEGEYVLRLFSCMQETCPANARTYVAAVKACSNLAEVERGEKQETDGKLVKMRSLERGMFFHSEAMKLSFDSNVYLASALIDMYARCGSLIDARSLFEKLHKPDVVCWNVLMLRYAESGEGVLALKLYDRMTETDRLCFVAAFKACASIGAKEEAQEIQGRLIRLASLEKGMSIHSRAETLGFSRDLYVANSTIDMYGKCGSMEDASRVFDVMPSRTLVSWNALMLGYAENSQGELGLKAFQELLLDGNFPPDGRTYAAALKSCGSAADLRAGKYIHSLVCSSGIESDTVLVTCLLDSYGKTGSMVNAQLVFDSSRSDALENRTALMTGYSSRGDTEHVFSIFNMILEEGLEPDAVTFVCMLTVCSHAGLVGKGKLCFEMMVTRYRIPPCMEHYHCMVDILGRANELEEALGMVRRVPFKPNAVTWMTLLGACVKWKNVGVGRIAFDELVKLDERDCASYMLMAALYRGAGMREEQLLVEASMKIKAHMN